VCLADKVINKCSQSALDPPLPENASSVLTGTRLDRYGRYYIDQFSLYFVPFKRGRLRRLLSILSRVFVLYK
jgi:hypothetical protein